MKSSLLALSAAVLLCGCSTVPMPANVSTGARPGVNGTYVNAVDFSYAPAAPVDFPRLKLCVAENVSNSAITLTDSAGSHFTPSGWWHQDGNTTTVQGGQAIQYVDDAQQVMLARGNLDAGSTAMGLTREFARYQLRASIKPGQIGLVFTDIEQAQQATGSVSNSGFTPVGTWSGAGPMQIYTALQSVADRIKNCAD